MYTAVPLQHTSGLAALVDWLDVMVGSAVLQSGLYLTREVRGFDPRKM